MISISSISTTTSSSRITTMPSQLQQHHDNGVCDDINVVTNQSNNPIMENTMNNVKNTHNNRQILYNNHDPQNQQHHNESYSRRNCEDEDILIVNKNVNKKDNVKIINSTENNNHNRIDNNEGTIVNYKSNTIDNNNINRLQNMSSFPRRKSSVLDISSLLCELPAANLSYDSSSSVDEDSSMDDVSSHLGDTESLGSPYSFHKNSSTPATTPPYSPPGGTTTTNINSEKRLLINNNNNNNDNNNNNNNDDNIMLMNNYHSQRDLQFKNNDYHHQQHQNYQENDNKYTEQERFQENNTPWKRPRIMNQDNNSNPLVLPPIRVPDLRSECENEQFVRNHHQPPSPDHGKINSPVDHHSSQKSWNHLEQFAAITEAYRTSSSNSSHADIMDSVSSNIRLPPASSLTNNNNHSFENNNNKDNFQNMNSSLSSVQQQSQQPPPPLLRRSSFDAPQTRYSPYTPTTLNPYVSSRLLSNVDQRRHSDLSNYTTPITSSSENSYLHHNHNSPTLSSSPYGYDRDVNRHYMVPQQRSPYGGMHSPPSPNTTYSVPHHGYPLPSHNSHHHLQMSHHHHHHHHHIGSPYMDPTNSGTMVKAKRKRANANQLKVLNQVFQHTFFPSTELRIQLGKQLGMSPRTVQIWFQNKRQSWRSKSRATTNSPIKDDDGQIDDDNLDVDERNVNNNNVVNENLISRRSSNSSLSCSDDDETGRRSIPDSPLENSYSCNDSYFTRDNNSNENVVTSNGNVTSSTQNSYFTPPQHSNNNEDYYHHRRSNSGGNGSNVHVMTGSLQHHNNTNNNTGVITPTSPLPPPSTLTNQLPSPVYSPSSTVCSNERLPPFASSFAHTSYPTPNVSLNNYDPFANNRLPAPIMINHRSQAQSSFGNY